jgi:hyperosmotically inducible protein
MRQINKSTRGDMMKRILITAGAVMVVAISSTPAPSSPLPQQQDRKSRLEQRSSRRTREARDLAYLTREIRKELVTLPYFSVFDWLEGNVQADGTVQLRGQVTRPTLKRDSQRRVERVEGVSRVVNRIEVLPLSPNDDRLRRAVYRELFNSNSPLFRYGQQAVPPIHIIVRNGRLTLKGVVASEGDRNFANIKARGVPGLFEVRNELRIENEG